MALDISYGRRLLDSAKAAREKNPRFDRFLTAAGSPAKFFSSVKPFASGIRYSHPVVEVYLAQFNWAPDAVRAKYLPVIKAKCSAKQAANALLKYAYRTPEIEAVLVDKLTPAGAVLVAGQNRVHKWPEYPEIHKQLMQKASQV